MTTSEIKERKQYRISIRWKVLIGFTVLFSVLYLLALNMFTNLAVNETDDQVQEDLTQVMESIAENVDVDMMMDLVETGEKNDAGFSDDPRFAELLGYLVDVQSVEPNSWPYLYIPAEKEDQIYFVVDVWAASDDPDNAGGFMDPYTSNSGWIVAGLSDLEYRAVEHRIVQDLRTYAASVEESNPGIASALESLGDWLTDNNILKKKDFGTYCDQYGCWASGYMPLVDSAENKVAAVGVDFTANYLIGTRNAVRTRVRSAFLYSYPILIVLIFLVANLFTRPLLRLSEAADRIAEGDYEVDFTQMEGGRFPDEISTLAKVFETMVGKIYQRELTLRREVAKLRIEIDQTKKKAEVSEIVDSDFFKDLQSRASDLKSRRDQGKK